MAVGTKQQVVFVALVPPVGSRRLSRPHQRRDLAVHQRLGAVLLDVSQPLGVDTSAVGDLAYGHPGPFTQPAQILTTVSGLT